MLGDEMSVHQEDKRNAKNFAWNFVTEEKS